MTQGSPREFRTFGASRPFPTSYDQLMNREERIAWAKRKAAETAPERARQREKDAAERSARIASMGSGEATRLPMY